MNEFLGKRSTTPPEEMMWMLINALIKDMKDHRWEAQSFHEKVEINAGDWPTKTVTIKLIGGQP